MANMISSLLLAALALAGTAPARSERAESAIVLDRFLDPATAAYVVEPGLDVAVVTNRTAIEVASDTTAAELPVDSVATISYALGATESLDLYQRFIENPKLPVDWTGVTSVRFWMHNTEPAAGGSGVTLQVRLFDGFDCTTLCGDSQSHQVWSATATLLDAAAEWTQVEVPIDDFELLRGPAGHNDVLDLIGVVTWGISVVGTGEAGSGSFMIGAPSAVGPSLFAHQLGRIEPSRDAAQGGWFRLFSSGSYASEMYTSQAVYPNGVDGMDTPVYELDYLVERVESWGGFLSLEHMLPGEMVYDLSDATHVTFNINILERAFPSGRLHLRLSLFDVSDCVVAPCTDTWRTEAYFSFNFVLENNPGWSKIVLPLVGSGSFDDPFVRPGWTGIVGNNRLDKNAIKGFGLEISAGTKGPQGSTTTGKFQISDLAVEKNLPPPPPPPACVASDNFVMTGGAFYEIEFGQQHCCEICDAEPRCLFFQINERLCMLFDGLQPEFLEFKSNSFDMYTLGWNIDAIPNACEGPEAVCDCGEDGLIDCQNANLMTVPVLSGPRAAEAKVLDLRGNRNITGLLKGMLDGAPKLERVDLRDTQLSMVDSEGLPSSLATFDTDLEGLRNVASQSQGRGKAFADVCCRRELLPFSDSSSDDLFACSEVQDWTPCVDCAFLPYHTYDAESKPLATIRAADLFGDGAASAENCGELCSRTDDCTHFTWDGRSTLVELTCYLLTRGEGLAKFNSSGYWQYADTPQLPGFISGYPAATRALVADASVSVVAAANFTVGPEGNFSGTYVIKLDSMPMRGAVWVTPALRFLSPETAAARGVEVSVSPDLIVIYPEEWDEEVVVTVRATFGSSSTGAVDAEITHQVESCDEGFMLEPTQAERTRLPVRISLNTPVEDRNLSTMVKAFSLVLFGISLATALGFMVWTLRHKSHPVVGASQPIFLAMIALGGVVTSFAILPATFDDTYDEEGLAREGDYTFANLGCNLLVWFYAIGFVLTFAPLFAKTWRLARIVNRKDLKRVKISNVQVAAICACLILAEAAIIIGWNIAAPLYYLREVVAFDEVGNPLESVGLCVSDNDSTPFLATLLVFHLVILCYGTYILNSVKNLERTVLSEGYYVKLTLFSNLQLLALSVPLLIIVAQDPVTTMFLRSGVVFLTNMCGLVLIFYPKIKAWNNNVTDVLKSSSDKSGSNSASYTNKSKSKINQDVTFSEQSKTNTYGRGADSFGRPDSVASPAAPPFLDGPVPAYTFNL